MQTSEDKSATARRCSITNLNLLSGIFCSVFVLFGYSQQYTPWFAMMDGSAECAWWALDPLGLQARICSRLSQEALGRRAVCCRELASALRFGTVRSWVCATTGHD